MTKDEEWEDYLLSIGVTDLNDSSGIEENLKPYVCTDVDFGYYILLSKMRN